jgi:hypothetical protein
MSRFTLSVALALVWVSVGHAQRSGAFLYSYGPRVAPGYGAYPGGYVGPGVYFPVPNYYYGRASQPGPAGPRAVTWYTPGLGYASNVQTGLPWYGATPTSARVHSGAAGAPMDSTLARQERVRRRMETVYAVNHHQLGRDYPKFLDQSLVADSKWKKQPAAAEPAGASTSETSALPASAKEEAEAPPAADSPHPPAE